MFKNSILKIRSWKKLNLECCKNRKLSPKLFSNFLNHFKRSDLLILLNTLMLIISLCVIMIKQFFLRGMSYLFLMVSRKVAQFGFKSCKLNSIETAMSFCLKK